MTTVPISCAARSVSSMTVWRLPRPGVSRRIGLGAGKGDELPYRFYVPGDENVEREAPLSSYISPMPNDAAPDDPEFPKGTPDERELFLDWLRYLRGAVATKASGLTDSEARWTPAGGVLISLLGIVNHLTHVEWRWIDGAMLGEQVSRSEREFTPGPELTVDDALAAYRAHAEATDAAVRSMPLTQPTRSGDGTDLRWVLIHLINETARHAGHADTTRELLDGTAGE